MHSVAFCFFVNFMLVVMCSILRRRDIICRLKKLFPSQCKLRVVDNY